LPMPVSARQCLYRAKAHQIARATEWLLRAPLPVWVEDCPNVGPIYYEDPKSGEGLLAIVSGSLDPVEARLHTRLRLTDLFTGQAPADLRIEPLSVRFFRTKK